MQGQFSQADMQRIARVVRKVERDAINPPIPDAATADHRTAQVCFVRVTSTTSSSGYWPGKILLSRDTEAVLDPFHSVNDDIDLADCWIQPAGGISGYAGGT